MFSEPRFSVLQHQEVASLATEIAVSRLPVDLASPARSDATEHWSCTDQQLLD
jgi:hypothetical protein